MLRNYLKIAIRNLWKHKGYSAINLLGLSVGLASCLLIGLYLRHEWSFDRYHEQSDRLYRLANHVAGASYENGIAKVSGPWGLEAKANIPEVKEACRFVFFGQALMSQGENRFYESEGLFADPAVFELFSWRMLAGEVHSALSEPNTLVLTRPFAKKYFGKEDPLGKTITINNETEYRVTGVMEAVPSNSHFTFDFLASMASLEHPDLNDWVRFNQFYTYLLLKPGARPETVANKMDAILDQHLDEQNAQAYTPFLQPIADVHLHSKLHREMAVNSDISYLYIFGAIALFILFIACLNFINLATARAMERAKEVGVRKVTGATRRMLRWQFLGESVLMVLLAAVAGIGLAELFLPSMNHLLEMELRLDWWDNYELSIGLAVMALLVALFSGLYPAFVLSSFRPIQVLKGQLSKQGGSARLRRGLVVAQFTVAIFLIIATLVVNGQLDYIRKKNLGFNKEQVVVIPMRSPESLGRLETIKKELRQIPGVLKVSAFANRPGGSDYGVPYQAVGLPPGQQPAMRCLVVDEDFLNTYGMELARGRGFSAAMPTDTSAYLINETAARQLGWDKPVGQQLAMPAIGRGVGPIIGVVRDFHFRSLHEEITPLYFFVQPAWFSQFSLRLQAGKMEEALAQIEDKWQAFEPDYPFTYSFFDESFDNLHRAEERTSAIIHWFALLAILLTCLGIFGLSSYTTARRTKEIGIRKVLGATAARIFGLLAWDFLGLVLLAFALAAGPAWWLSRRWLSDFAFRIELGWGYFLLAGLLAGLIALLSVSWQSMQAARRNPVEALKYE